MNATKTMMRNQQKKQKSTGDPLDSATSSESMKTNETKAGTVARYVYRDYSRVLPDEGESVLGAIANSVSGPSSVKQQKLPLKLNALLNDPELSQIIGWMPHGRAWKILKPKQFVKEVLPIYFDYCNYNSFVRLINAWGFRRLNTGPDRHAYYHELFLKDMPHLHSRMRRITGKDEKPPIDQEDEPDLYRISQLFPVPPHAVPSSSTRLSDVRTSFTSATRSSDVIVNSISSVPSYGDMHSSQSSFSEAHTMTQPSTTHNATFAASDTAVAAPSFNPFIALAAQAQQATTQQQNYLQFLTAATSMPFSTCMVPSYAQQMSALSQQQYNLACLSSFLQGSVRGTGASAAGQPVTSAADSLVESPVMYIPVYPSTLAALGATPMPL